MSTYLQKRFQSMDGTHTFHRHGRNDQMHFRYCQPRVNPCLLCDHRMDALLYSNRQLTSGSSASKNPNDCWQSTKRHLCGPHASRLAATLWLARRGTPSRPGLLMGRWQCPLQPGVGTMTRMMTWRAPSLPASKRQLSSSLTQQQMEQRRAAPNQGSLGQAGRISSNLFLRTPDQSQSPGQVCTLQ